MSSYARSVTLAPALLTLVAACASAAESPDLDDDDGELAIARATPGYAPLYLSLTFDDGHAEHAKVAAMLRGIPSTFFVNSGHLGDAGSLAASDLDVIAASGHEIGAHTRHHVHLPALAGDHAMAEMCDDRDALGALGHAAFTLAYPFGDDSPAVRELAAACGFDGARDVGGLRNRDPWTGAGFCGSTASSLSRPAAERFPPADPFAIRSHASIRPSCTHDDLRHMALAAASDASDLALREPRWLVLNFHRVCSDCPGDAYAVHPDRLRHFAIWLRARGGVIPILDASGRVIARRPLVLAGVGGVLATRTR
jgi:peptidoglycan/xylan/chitin deacetylase (PgdA/CDA1 family)